MSKHVRSSMKLVQIIIEPRHEISNNVVCATNKCSDQPAHTRSLIRAFARSLTILPVLSYWLNFIWSWRLYRLVWAYTCQNATFLEISYCGSFCILTICHWKKSASYIEFKLCCTLPGFWYFIMHVDHHYNGLFLMISSVSYHKTLTSANSKF